MPRKEISIKDYFTPPMQEEFGKSIGMFELKNTQSSKSGVNIINGSNIRLFKILAKDEGDKSHEGNFAQIKIIPMEARKILIYKNIPSDPEQKRLPKFRDFEITYHGPTRKKKTPITHISESRPNGKKHHTTLINRNFPIESNSKNIVPILSFFEGRCFDNKIEKSKNPKKNNAHKFVTPRNYRSRIDIYVSSSKIDLRESLGGHFMFSFLFSPDYVLSSMGKPLIHSPISRPITIFKTKDYFIWIRCSVSEYSGRPYIQLFSNEDYYDDFSSRSLAWKGRDGKLVWSTIKEEDKNHTYLPT